MCVDLPGGNPNLVTLLCRYRYTTMSALTLPFDLGKRFLYSISPIDFANIIVTCIKLT